MSCKSNGYFPTFELFSRIYVTTSYAARDHKFITQKCTNFSIYFNQVFLTCYFVIVFFLGWPNSASDSSAPPTPVSARFTREHSLDSVHSLPLTPDFSSTCSAMSDAEQPSPSSSSQGQQSADVPCLSSTSTQRPHSITSELHPFDSVNL